jgi:peptide/nickel transport system permease protein
LAEALVAIEDPAVLPDTVGVRQPRRFTVLFWIAVVWLVLIIALAVFASVLPLDSPTQVFACIPNSAPSWHHLLGCDELGRDMLSRIVFGARVSLEVGFTAVFIGLVFGGTAGLVAGYFGGKTDLIISSAMNVLLAFPALVLALAVIAFLGQSLRNVILILGLLSIAPLARLVRASTVVYAQREFVTAARMMGFRSRRILFREVLPNVMPSTLSFAIVAVAVAIVAEGALSFLGLSVRPPAPTWGNMIAEGSTYLSENACLALCPAAVLCLTVLALNFAGDGLRSFFDVKDSAL